MNILKLNDSIYVFCIYNRNSLFWSYIDKSSFNNKATLHHQRLLCKYFPPFPSFKWPMRIETPHTMRYFTWPLFRDLAYETKYFISCRSSDAFDTLSLHTLSRAHLQRCGANDLAKWQQRPPPLCSPDMQCANIAGWLVGSAELRPLAGVFN